MDAGEISKVGREIETLVEKCSKLIDLRCSDRLRNFAEPATERGGIYNINIESLRRLHELLENTRDDDCLIPTFIFMGFYGELEIHFSSTTLKGDPVLELEITLLEPYISLFTWFYDESSELRYSSFKKYITGEECEDGQKYLNVSHLIENIYKFYKILEA